MALYAIGDLHLHFQSEVKNKGQLKDRVWKKHDEKFLNNCNEIMTAEDTLVLVGDHSWGKKLAECEEDLEYIRNLPGRKILFRGNHDMFWDVKKTASLNERYPDLSFVQDCFETYQDYAIVGTKGYTFEGPFYINQRGHIVGWDEQEEEHAKKLVERELERLRTSFESAKAAGFHKYIMFLHYPPTSILEKESGFTKMAEEYGASKVVYAHCHGETRFYDSVWGNLNGVNYQLVSGDYCKWVPAKILD